MTRTTSALLGALLSLTLPAAAHAHISLLTRSGSANATQEITFGVGHGCAGADTFKVRILIPPNVTAARPMTSGFGKTSVEKNDAGLITAISWQKADADVLTADLEYYKLTVRIKVPNTPFATIYFPAEQSCRSADGTVSVVNWAMLPGDPPAAAGGEDEPAPALNILPSRLPGWNKFTVTTALALTDLQTLFGDALIVWKGSAAFSVNPSTTELIAGSPGVTPLTTLAADDVIWVKY